MVEVFGTLVIFLLLYMAIMLAVIIGKLTELNENIKLIYKNGLPQKWMCDNLDDEDPTDDWKKI